MCDVGFGVVLLRCYSFYGRSVVVGCDTVGNVELLPEPP